MAKIPTFFVLHVPFYFNIFRTCHKMFPKRELKTIDKRGSATPHCLVPILCRLLAVAVDTQSMNDPKVTGVTKKESPPKIIF